MFRMSRRVSIELLTMCAIVAGCAGADPSSDSKLPTTHVVQPGDTLTSIAVKYYGAASGVHALFESNSDVLKNPNQINAGQILKIPPIPPSLSAFQTSNPGNSDVDTASTPGLSDGRDSAKADSCPPTFHVVLVGETLQGIAQKYYGSPEFDSLITASKSNHTLVQSQTIPVGAKLYIPPLTDDMPIH